ncbi:MAG TPA: nicotinate-nucleotide adenylyltransferase [Pyrinomonadaceae bacterium]|jgi:nicotinate-nucleotide adenylyltransferase|nr:nicotinate-nucleotide adenylyltransferase [Pyrinomonadaceae bacterium]
MRRIGLYGGTFDPVHVGHLEVARKVSQLFEIEKLIFVPAQMAPHKIGRPVTEPIHRYAMLALATQDDPGLVISTFELDTPNRRYTVETIEHFQRESDDSTELFFIMGADSWSEITTWYEWERLLTMTNHIVVTRPGFPVPTTHVGALKERIFFTDVVMKDVSATNIRRLARQGKTDDLVGLVPGPVLDYIKKYRIYREVNETEFNS